MRRVVLVKPIGQVNTRMKAISDPDLDFVTKGDLIGVLWIGYARPRDPVFQLETSWRRGWRFINETEVPRATERGQRRKDHGYKYTDPQRKLHLASEAIRSVSPIAAGQLLFFSVCLRAVALAIPVYSRLHNAAIRVYEEAGRTVDR